jgi:hypothetical protein
LWPKDEEFRSLLFEENPMHTLALLGSALYALAGNPTVKVTSFYYTNQYPDRTAEICGTLTGGNAMSHITIIVDPGDHQGTYGAWPGINGDWCALVNSNSGHAAVSTLGAEAATVQAEATRGVR